MNTSTTLSYLQPFLCTIQRSRRRTISFSERILRASKTFLIHAFFQNVQGAVASLLEVGVNVTGNLVDSGGELLKAGPEIAGQSANLVEGVVKTANETGPAVQKVNTAASLDGWMDGGV